METIGHNLFGCNLDIVIFWPASAVDGTRETGSRGVDGAYLASMTPSQPLYPRRT